MTRKERLKLEIDTLCWLCAARYPSGRMDPHPSISYQEYFLGGSECGFVLYPVNAHPGGVLDGVRDFTDTLTIWEE